MIAFRYFLYIHLQRANNIKHSKKRERNEYIYALYMEKPSAS